MAITALDNTPTNKNLLSPLSFKFQIKRSPHLNFFVQKVNIPGLSFNYPIQTNPFTSIPIPGDRIHFSDLNVTFKVDEDLQNYLEVQNWIRALGFPENFSEYAQIKGQSPVSGQTIRSDISLIVGKAIYTPNYEVVFKEAFPVSLSDLLFDTTDSSVDYITASATFRYIYYDITKL